MKRTVVATTFVLTLVLASLTAVAQAQSREDILRELESKRGEVAALEKKFLAPSDTDLAEYAAFLSQPDTGVIRLLPRDKYDGEAYKKTAKSALTIRGGGAYYSFVRSTHEYGYGSDISLDHGYLSVGFAGADHGLLLDLGDVSLEEMILEHPAVRAISEYKPSSKRPEVDKAYQTLWQGMELSGFVFKSRLDAKVSNTYLLRSVSYERSDTVTAFRVVRQDTDGSIILVFKVLKKLTAPKLDRTQTASLEN